MKLKAFALVLFFTISSFGMHGIQNPELEIKKDSLIKVYELPIRTFRNLNISALDDTIVSIIKQIQPYVSEFNPKTKIIPSIKLAIRDTICVYFEHPFDNSNAYLDEAYGFEGRYGWYIASSGMQFLYSSRRDSIMVFPPFYSDVKGQEYSSFSKNLIKRRKDKLREKFKRSACCLRIIINRRKVKSIEGWYYY